MFGKRLHHGTCAFQDLKHVCITCIRNAAGIIFRHGFFTRQYSILHQPIHLDARLDAKHIVKIVFGLHQRLACQRAFTMHVCLTENRLVYRHLKFLVLLPQHFRPMAAVGVDCPSVIEYHSLNICYLLHLILFYGCLLSSATHRL